jgi:hypothetical protein
VAVERVVATVSGLALGKESDWVWETDSATARGSATVTVKDWGH